jgi:hypothetical protein
MKGSGPEETLRKGSMPKGNDLGAPGNSEGPETRTTSSLGSNLETLRQGSKPGMESVRSVKFDQACQTKARAAYRASNGDTKAPRGGNIRKADEMD